MLGLELILGPLVIEGAPDRLLTTKGIKLLLLKLIEEVLSHLFKELVAAVITATFMLLFIFVRWQPLVIRLTWVRG